MDRRRFSSLLAAMAASITGRVFSQEPSSGNSRKFQSTWDSLERHQVPDWFQDAKLGIFIHWGLYSVPAWAPQTGTLGSLIILMPSGT